MPQPPIPAENVGAPPHLLQDHGQLLVQCTVCHIAGVVEALPLERGALRATWPSVACVFTDGCVGHMWPDALN